MGDPDSYDAGSLVGWHEGGSAAYEKATKHVQRLSRWNTYAYVVGVGLGLCLGFLLGATLV